MNECRINIKELPGKGETICVVLGKTPVLIANVDNNFYAVDDTCSHEDASLSLGALKGTTISCPLHGSRFCLKSGQAIDEPAETPLTTYRIVHEENGIRLLEP